MIHMKTSKLITQRQQGFLDAFQVTGQVKSAAAQAGCSRELHYGAMRTSDTYREEFSLVQQRLAAELEEALWQRAVYGVKIPKFYRGQLIGYEIRYSDTLLMRLLEARDPEKFGGIREELQRQSREDGLGVRWDREEVGRPTLPRMTGPMPPAPPRPPRPPVPPIAECGEPVTYAEWAAVRGITGMADCGPVDEEKLKRWAAGENLGSVEWVPDEAAMDLVSEDADREEEVAEADGPESGDSDADFCVRWGAAEPEWPEDESPLQAPESVSAETTRPGGPGWETGWLFRPGVRAGRKGKPDCDGDLLRNDGPSHGENAATFGRFPVRKRLRRGLACHRGEPLHPNRCQVEQPLDYRPLASQRPMRKPSGDAAPVQQDAGGLVTPAYRAFRACRTVAFFGLCCGMHGRDPPPIHASGGHSPRYLPNTAHWRRSPLSATHRTTPPRSRAELWSSGTLAKMKKPFDVLAEGLLVPSSRGDRI